MEDKITLQEALTKISIGKQKDILFIVRLLENPQSLVAFPGKISLFNHDCLHMLLNINTGSFGEAFLVGFTMGNAQAKSYHVRTFKIFAKYFYPQNYRFSNRDIRYFDIGFQDGKTFPCNLSEINFKSYLNLTVAQIRQKIGLNKQILKKVENVLQKESENVSQKEN